MLADTVSSLLPITGCPNPAARGLVPMSGKVGGHRPWPTFPMAWNPKPASIAIIPVTIDADLLCRRGDSRHFRTWRRWRLTYNDLSAGSCAYRGLISRAGTADNQST